MIGNSGSPISGQSLSLVLLLLLQPLWGSGVAGVLGFEEESGQIMDEIPAAHREGLELLKTVLAMDVQWSAFWSEKLKPELADDAELIPEFCPSFPKFDSKPINTISVIKNVMKHCPHSGMYVEFAVKVLALSVNCMFNRHAKVQLAIIKKLPFDAIKEFARHLGRLVGDYRLMANPMATIGVELHPLVALSRFFNEVKRQWITYIENNEHQENYRESIEFEAVKLNNLLKKSSEYCDMSPKIWHGLKSKDTVELNMDNIEPIFWEEKTDDSLTSTLPEDEVVNEPSVRKAHKLRWILYEEFEKLRLGKLPQEVWNSMFESIILVRQIQAKENLNRVEKVMGKASSLFRKNR